MGRQSREASAAFTELARISERNAASIEVLAYVDREVAMATARILEATEGMHRDLAAIDAQTARFRITDEGE